MTKDELIDAWCKFRGRCTSEDLAVLRFAHKTLQEDFIKEACAFLRNNMQYSHMEDVVGYDPLWWFDFIVDFKKAMEQ